MGLWTRITAPWRQKATPDEWFQEFGVTGRTNSSVYVNQTTAMQATAVMACVRVISQDVAKLPVRVYQRVGRKKVDLDDHPLALIFRKPNSWQTWLEFAEMMEAALQLRGNAMAAVLRDGRGRPVGMLPMHPDRVFLYEGPNGAVFYNYSRFGLHETAVFSSFPQMIPADDVFHLRWMPGLNSLIGMSRIAYAREAIGYSLSLEMHGANISGQGARPSGVLQTDKKLSKDTADRLATRWQALHSGVANSGKTAVLEDGLKWQALTMTSVDMEYIASRKFQVLEICRIFGVAPAKIAVTDGTTMRNIEEVNLSHLTETIHPELVRWEQKFQAFFDLPPDIAIEFDTSEMLRANLVSRTNAARVLVMSGLATPNDAGMSFGSDPVPGGDVRLVPANMVPILEAGKNTMASPIPAEPAGPGSDQTGAPADGGDGDPAQLPDG